MRCRTMLLGGAVALALSGAAYAQAQQTAPQAAPGTDQINAGSAAGTQTTTPGTESTATTKTSTHHRHHYAHHHHHHHLHHHTKTASLHHASTPGERQATRSLNDQQLQGGTMTNTGTTGTQPGTYTQPGAQPGSENANPPASATYTQPQGSQGMQPGNAGYQKPQNSTGEPTPGYQSEPGAAGPNGAQGNPTTSTDQNATPPASSNPGS